MCPATYSAILVLGGIKQAWANPGFLGADIYLRTQDKSTTIHEQIIANLYYVMKLFADIRNYMRTFANPTVSIYPFGFA